MGPGLPEEYVDCAPRKYPEKPKLPYDVVVEVRGGAVVAVYAKDQDIILIDWDSIGEGDTPGFYPVESLDQLPIDTKEQVWVAVEESCKE